MKISISEARRRLPELVRKVRDEARVQITLHGEVVAELRAALPEPEPGAAARKLQELMRTLPAGGRQRNRVSSRVKSYLYGRALRRR